MRGSGRRWFAGSSGAVHKDGVSYSLPEAPCACPDVGGAGGVLLLRCLCARPLVPCYAECLRWCCPDTCHVCLSVRLPASSQTHRIHRSLLTRTSPQAPRAPTGRPCTCAPPWAPLSASTHSSCRDSRSRASKQQQQEEVQRQRESSGGGVGVAGVVGRHTHMC